MQIKDVIYYIKTRNIAYEFEGDAGVYIETYCPLNKLKMNAITWARDIKNVNVQELNNIDGVILVAEIGEKLSGNEFEVIYVDNVHRTFFEIVEHFFKKENPDVHKSYVEKSAVVEAKKLGKNIYVGHHSYIGSNVKIGNNVVIRHNVTIQGNVSIGDNTVIESGATIGVLGYGPYWDEEGNPKLVPHVGSVVIGENVYIGANACVARGCLGETVLEDYVKIDNLVHIAHNVTIKKGAMIVAGSTVCGSAVVEQHSWIAPGAVVNESLVVGEKSILGIGAVVIKNVEKKKVMAGNPAKVLREVVEGEL